MRFMQKEDSRLKRCFCPAEGVEPDLVTYNLAVRACGGQSGSKLRSAQLDQAFQLLADMRAAGVAPDQQTVTSMLALCAQAGAGRRALALYEVRLLVDSDVVGLGIPFGIRLECMPNKQKEEKVDDSRVRASLVACFAMSVLLVHIFVERWHPVVTPGVLGFLETCTGAQGQLDVPLSGMNFML